MSNKIENGPVSDSYSEEAGIEAGVELKQKTALYYKRFEQACILSGPVSVLLVFIGLAIGHIFPPLSPSLTVDEVAAHYQKYHVQLRTGAIFIMISTPFYAAWCGAIAIHTKRIPGCPTLVWVAGAIGAGISCSVFILPGLFLAIASFRPDRNPDVLYMLHDFFTISLTAPWEPLAMQTVAFCYAILADPSKKPTFPRWVAYYNLFMLCCFGPSTGLHFVHSGLLAWNGGLSWWLPVCAYGLSLILDCIYLLRKVAPADYDHLD